MSSPRRHTHLNPQPANDAAPAGEHHHHAHHEAPAPAAPAPNLTNSEKVAKAYQDALDQLEATLHRAKKSKSLLYADGLNVYNEAYKMGHRKKPRVSLVTITEILQLADKMVKGSASHQMGPQGYRHDANDLYSKAKQIRPSRAGKIFGGILLGLLGTAVVAASGIIAAISFGLLAPVSILGIKLGLSMMVGGLGALGVMGSGMTFFSAAKKDPFSSAAKDLAQTAKHSLRK